MKRLLIFVFIVITVTSTSLAQNAIGAGFFNSDHILIDTSGCTTQGGWYSAYNSDLSFCGVGVVSSFEFYGSEFALWAMRYAGSGDVEICIDTTCSTSSAYSATTVYGEWMRFYGLSTGFHTVTIEPLTGASFPFDALYVAPAESGGGSNEIHQFTVNVTIAEATPEVTPEVTPESTAEPAPYDVIEIGEDVAHFEYSMTAGDAINTVIMTVLVMILFVVTGVLIWKK